MLVKTKNAELNNLKSEWSEKKMRLEVFIIQWLERKSESSVWTNCFDE